MTENKRFTDTEAYFSNMMMVLTVIIIYSLFPYAIKQLFIILIGGIGFLNLCLFLDAWK